MALALAESETVRINVLDKEQEKVSASFSRRLRKAE